MSMIVCPEPPAVEIGGQMLAMGGNAADAAVAVAFVQGVANPLMCGLSGAAVLSHMDRDAKPTVLNGEVAIGSGPVPHEWVDTLGERSEAIGRYHVPSEDNQIGATSAMVPGFVAACQAAHDHFGSGRLTWRDLIEPSIRLAEGGFEVGPNLAQTWSRSLDQSTPAYPSLREKPALLGHLDPRAGRPMSIVPGRRIGSGMPTIARRDGQIRLVIGAPGGSRIITSIFQTLLEVLGRGTPVDAAVKKLRYHSEEDRLVHLEPGWPEEMAAALQVLGNRTQWSTYQARVQAIGVAADGALMAGVDPRGGAVYPRMPTSFADQAPMAGTGSTPEGKTK